MTCLQLRATVVEAVTAHAMAELPNEACGLVSGRDGIGLRYHPARNAAASPYRFDIASDDLVRIILGIEAAGEELVAIVHSHPRTAAVPSASDTRLAEYEVPYLIVSLAGNAPLLRAWDVGGGAPRELRLEVEFGQPPSSTTTMVPVAGSKSTSTAAEPSSSPDR